MPMSGVVPAVYIHIPTWVQNLVTWEEEDGYKISLFASELLSGPSGASQWISNTSEFNTIRVSESNIGAEPMGFGPGRVWGMGYSRPIGFYMLIPAHRVGGPEKVWDTGGYGLSEVCIMAGSTVQ